MSTASTDPINGFESNAGSFSRSARRHGSSAPRPDMARRVMDIEELLTWAFVEELPKNDGLGGGPVGPVSPMSLIARYAVLGSAVDNWSREPGFPSALGGPHADALLVSAAFERLADCAEQEIEGALDLAPDLAALGIDEKQAVRRALVMVTAIVARCAKLKERPFFHLNTKPRPMRYDSGRPMVVRWEPQFSKTLTGNEVEHEVLVPVEVRAKGEYPFGSHSPLRYDPDPQSIVDERAEYLIWWWALDRLATELTGKLSSISVVPPSAAQRPWLGDVDLGKPPRVFADLTARTYRREAKETAAAHRMLGQRRSSGARGPAARRGAPVRAVAPAQPQRRACGAV